MTYFQHTKADVADARLAGRREVAELFAALLDDTARKLNGDDELDRQYLVEDLLSRGMELAKNYAHDMPQLFPALVDSARVTPAYPLLDGEPGKQEDTIDLTDAIRETWEAQTFDGGYMRHEHIGTPDERCLADIRSMYSMGAPVRCGRYYGHAIHETDFDTRSK